MNIHTTSPDKIYQLKKPFFNNREKGLTMIDVSRSVCITAYMESMLEDFDRVLSMKIDNSVKQRMRILLREHDKSSDKYLSAPLTLQMSNILTKEMDRHRLKVKQSVSKKDLDDKHFVLYLTYELRAILNALQSLDYKSTLSYSNAVKGLINGCNKWLCKGAFTDKMRIHLKREKTASALNGFMGECLTIFQEAEQEMLKNIENGKKS